MTISRRGLLFGLPLFIAGCQSVPNQQALYGDVPNEPYPLKKVPIEKIKPELRRQEVAYETPHAPGTSCVPHWQTPCPRTWCLATSSRWPRCRA